MGKSRSLGFLINISVTFLSIVLTLSIIELYMRHSPRFQHGGDRQKRNEGIAVKKPVDEKRIIIIGDSLVYGDGAKAEDTYPFQLQKKIRTRQNGKIQVINMGIMGVDTDEEAEILLNGGKYFRVSALGLEPDVVVWTFCINDIELLLSYPKSRPETIILPSKIHSYLMARYRTYLFFHTKFNQLLASTGIQASYTDYLKNIYSRDTKEWRLFERLLYMMIDQVKQRKIKLLLVIFPSLERLDASHPYLDLYAKVSGIGAAKGIEVLNLFPYFEGRDVNTLRVSILNGHPNEKAFDIASEAIYEALVGKGMVN